MEGSAYPHYTYKKRCAVVIFNTIASFQPDKTCSTDFMHY